MKKNKWKKLVAFFMCAGVLTTQFESHGAYVTNAVSENKIVSTSVAYSENGTETGKERYSGKQEVVSTTLKKENPSTKDSANATENMTTTQKVNSSTEDRTTTDTTISTAEAVTTTEKETSTTQNSTTTSYTVKEVPPVSEVSCVTTQENGENVLKVSLKSSLSVSEMKESRLVLSYRCDADNSSVDIDTFYQTASGLFEGNMVVPSGMTKGKYTLYKVSYVSVTSGNEVSYFITDTVVSEFQNTQEVVQDQVSEIQLSATAIQIRVNGTRKLTAICLPETAQDVGLEWESSDTSIATVDSKGVVTGKKKGTATITVTTTDGSDISASCKVKVSDTLVIVLDPGHGNKDYGAVNYSKKLYERNVNLEIAKACRDYLEKYEGVAVYLTRETNSGFLGLDERTKFAKACDADVFISLHNNASVSKRATGAEVWITRATHKTKFNKEMKALGKTILNNLGKCGVKKRGVYTRKSAYLKYANGSRADYYAVIRGSVQRDIPAMIVEHAYIDSSDYRFLNSKSKTKKLGEADAKAIASYYKLTKRTDNTEDIEVSGIKLNCNESYLKLKKNKTYQLKATVAPSNADNKSVTYTSNKSSVVTTTSGGKLRAVKKGTAVITCKAKDKGGMTRKLTVKVQ